MIVVEMEFGRVVRQRRMVRSFLPEPIDRATVDEVCDVARRAPSAGNTAAVQFLVLEGRLVHDYWDVTLPEPRRANFPWPGLLRAPVLTIVWTEPGAYVRRYREPDKASTAGSLGSDIEAWTVPYWYVDAGAAVMTMLLAAADHGLGACFFGLFGHEESVRLRFGVPEGHRSVGTVAMGWPSPDNRPSHSALRPRRALDTVMHRSMWQQQSAPIGATDTTPAGDSAQRRSDNLWAASHR